MSKNTNAEKNNENTTPSESGTAPKELTEIEKLKQQLEEAKAVMTQQAEIIEQQSAIIKQNVETFDKIKESTASDTIAGQNVMRVNEMMKEKTKVFYPRNPFDPDKTHVKVLNPITGKVDSVAVDEWVEVTRAVAEILERSAKTDKVTLMLQKKTSADYEQKSIEIDK